MAAVNKENRLSKPKKLMKIIDMPEYILNQKTDSTYRRCDYLGRGSSAKCFKVIDIDTNEVLTAKCIPEVFMKSIKQKTSVLQEINIHKSLKHENIVDLHSALQDKQFIYILLEYCEYKSLAELLKQRKTLTVTEVRYYMHQIIKGVQYLHEQEGVIHRDLKPSNIFLDKNLRVKIGDFGLALKAKTSQRFFGVAGTPNYISPEIILKAGHSFDCDIWSIGCVMYSLFVGVPPFQKKTVSETYDHIIEGKYKIPDHLDSDAAAMIRMMLNQDPEFRPTPYQLLCHSFFTKSQIPRNLHESCFYSAPLEKFGTLKPIDRKVFKTILRDMKRQIDNLLTSEMEIVQCFTDTENNKLIQSDLMITMWISKWSDFKNEHGFAYGLSNGVTGALFNDGTNLLISPNFDDINYIDEKGNEQSFDNCEIPELLQHKFLVLKYYREHLNGDLQRTGPPHNFIKNVAFMKYLITHVRHSNGISMLLSNGSLQFNGWNHDKFLICPLKQTISLIEKDTMKTYRYKDLRGRKISKNLFEKLCFASKNIDNVINTLKV